MSPPHAFAQTSNASELHKSPAGNNTPQTSEKYKNDIEYQQIIAEFQVKLIKKTLLIFIQIKNIKIFLNLILF